MKIAGRAIGERVLVIAEIGVNHDGSVDRAIELVHVARDAGADAIKLQVFAADRLMHRSARFAEYQQSRVAAADPAEMLRQYELDDAGLKRIGDAARSAGLIVLATPFSPEDCVRVAAVASGIKIASPDLVNRVLLRAALLTQLPMLLSTGAADSAEVERSASWLQAQQADFALLHCISSYPAEDADSNLGWIEWLRRFGAPVGYSDHSTHVFAGAFAVAAGASIVEKHITYDPAAAGPDHSASFGPQAFAEYVRLIRTAERMRGGGGLRRVLPCEVDVRSVSRQSLVARKPIAAGQVIRSEDLTAQRPASGISAEELDAVVGRVAARDAAAGEMLAPDHIAGGLP